MPITYGSVLVAVYDYSPTADDEVAIKEEQLLLLLDGTDEEWWKVKIKTSSQEDNGPSGLVPKAYVEEAKPITSAKALYDYTANGDGELTIAEDEPLSVYEQEEEWTLVKSNKPGGKAGYVPATYIELSGSVQQDEDDGAVAAAAAVPSPPAAVPRSSYSDPSELVAASHTKAHDDPVQTWSVSILDKKDKKKKGTLGVGNGAIFFASESDKTPVQQWKTGSVVTVTSDKAKHVDIQIASGAEVTTLRFVANSREVSEEIIEKVESSRQIASGASSSPPADHVPDPINTGVAKSHKNGASVRFAMSPDSVIPNPADEEDDVPDGEQASALYDFEAQASDELSVKEGETLIVLNRVESEEWWKCRNVKGEEGVVPSSYVELSAGSAPARGQSQDDEDDTAAEMATAKAAEQAAEQRRLEQVKERREAELRAADEKRRKREQERAEAEARAKELERLEQQRLEKERAAKQAARSSSGPRPSTDSEPRRSGAGPRPGKTRVWHDRTGQFKVEAEFLGMENGKIKLHKTNGVIIDVPSAKMSPEDMAFVEKLINAGKRPATSPDDDNVPLSVIAERRNSRPPPAAQRPVPQQPKKPQVDWFDFFLNAGCDLDDCTRYAASFNRDKIDETIVADIKDSTLRSLGLREGDIIRVLKAIEKKGWRHEDDSARKEQMRKDEELARQLQAQENAASPRRSTTTSPAPNLFTGPNGTLKNQTRRGRPPPSSKTAPISVDATVLSSTSGSISRGSTPQITTPAGGALTSSPVDTAGGSVASAPAVVAPIASGFDDDAWTPRPSSAKPASPAPAVALSPPPAPPAPVAAPVVAPAPAPVAAPVAPTPPPAPPAPPVAPAAAPVAPPAIQRPATTNPPATISQPASSQFDILAKIEQMRPPSAPIISQPTGFQTPANAPSSFQVGLGMGNSPVPVGQLLTAQQTGVLGPRGPPAPIPANQSLLTPLIPTTSGFNSFVPTRPGSTPSFGGLQSQPTGFQPSQPSFMQSQPTGFQPSQPSFLQSQPTGFQPSQPSFLSSQPTGFQPSQPSFLQSQPTGFQSSPSPNFMPQQTGFQPSPMASQSPPIGFQPTGMGGMFNGGGLQPQATGFQQNSFNSPPSNAPPQNNLSAANVFASMKSGTFAGGAGGGAPQSADKYDALRQPTGNFMAPQQTGFGYQPQQQFQPGYNGYQ